MSHNTPAGGQSGVRHLLQNLFIRDYQEHNNKQQHIFTFEHATHFPWCKSIIKSYYDFFNMSYVSMSVFRMEQWCRWLSFTCLHYLSWVNLHCFCMYMEHMGWISTWLSVLRRDCCWRTAGLWRTATSGAKLQLQSPFLSTLKKRGSIFSECILMSVVVCLGAAVNAV